MYPNLQKLLHERHISSYVYATIIGTTQGTAARKIRGAVDHSVEEAMKAMTIFPEYSFDYVFKRSEGTEE